MNVDGSNQVNISNSVPDVDGNPNWSPDGSKIVFSRVASGGPFEFELWVMNAADGSGQQNLSNDVNSNDDDADWSPDGLKIVFESNRGGSTGNEIWRMNADGSGKTQITFNSDDDSNPNYSPDGKKIVFRTNRDGGNREIYVMNADGSNPQNLSNDPSSESSPHWQPVSVLIGGTLLPIDSTSLILAGAQMTAAWMIPVIIAGIGFAIVIVRKF